MNNRRHACIVLSCCLLLGACSYVPSWMGGEKKKEPRLEGERIAVSIASSALQPDPTIASVHFTAPPVNQNAAWPQHSGNMTAAGGNLYANGEFANDTSATIGEGNEFISKLLIQPVVGGGLVYTMDAAGYVSAHEEGNIRNVKWRSEGASEEDEPDSFGGGLAYDNGVLYAVSGRGQIVAIDAVSGQMVWRRSLSLPFRSPPRIADGRLFAVTLDNQLFALQAATGDVLWTHRGISETTDIMHAVSPVIYGSLLVVPYSSGELYALQSSTGEEVWRDSMVTGAGGLQSSVSFTAIGGDPVVDGDVIFTVSTGGMFSVLHGGSGQHIWDRPVGATNTPWLAGDYIYLLTSDNSVVCFVKYNGKIRWATRLASYEDETDKEDLIIWKGPVMVNGTLVIAGSHGGFVRLDAGDGSILGTGALPRDSYTSPVVAGGRMFLASQDATLHALE